MRELGFDFQIWPQMETLGSSSSHWNKATYVEQLLEFQDKLL